MFLSETPGTDVLPQQVHNQKKILMNNAKTIDNFNECSIINQFIFCLKYASGVNVIHVIR